MAAPPWVRPDGTLRASSIPILPKGTDRNLCFWQDSAGRLVSYPDDLERIAAAWAARKLKRSLSLKCHPGFCRCKWDDPACRVPDGRGGTYIDCG